jgi:hypothetical protein
MIYHVRFYTAMPCNEPLVGLQLEPAGAAVKDTDVHAERMSLFVIRRSSLCQDADM